MNLRRLLYHLRVNILHDQGDQDPMDGGLSDQLWSDETLVEYIDDAQQRLARSALVFRDGTTPEVTQIQMVANQREYLMHPSIFGVLSARCEGDRADLARAGHSQFDTYHTPDTYFFDPSSLSSMPPGKVVAFGTDEYFVQTGHGETSQGVLRCFPVPSSDHIQTIKLRVLRGPLLHLTIDNLDAYPEVPQIHHLDMLNWAAHLALTNVDRDIEDQKRSADFATKFEGRVKEASEIAKRKLFVPMQWGFGRNGWSYEGNI
jgi:hypothetical protein